MGARGPQGGGGPPGPEPLDAGLSHEKARDCPALAGRGRRLVRPRGAAAWPDPCQPFVTALVPRSQPPILPCGRWPFSSTSYSVVAPSPHGRGRGVRAICEWLGRLHRLWRTLTLT